MMSRNASMKVKRKIFNEYILPVMAYGSDTWALNKAMKGMMTVAQRKMEHIMLGISLGDQKHYTWIHQYTETEDIVTAIRQNKHNN